MIKKFLLASVFAGCLFSSAQAATIFADDFNSNSADQLNGTPTGWTLVSGIVDIIGAGGSFDWYPGNGSYLDLDGSAAALGQNSLIRTNAGFDLAAGTYLLSFDYGINHNDSSGDTDFITASIGVLIPGTVFSTTVDAGALNHGASVLTPFSISFTLATAVNNAMIFIAGNSSGGSDQSGGIFDNIRLETASNLPSEVPVPGAALLLLSGLAA